MSTENLSGLQESLISLHQSVGKLIKTLQDNAHILQSSEEIMDKLPLLDFYNDDLLRNINNMQDKSAET